MNKDTEYFSEESLEELIAQVEQQELVMAPPDLKECILGRVKKDSRAAIDKKEEYRRYCIRVWTSVAAAVLLVFTLPLISEKIEPPQENRLETLLGGNLIFDNDDVFYFFKEDGGR